MQWTKTTVFHLNTPLKLFFLGWTHDGEIRICNDLGIQVWNWSEIEESSFSWKIRIVRTLMQKLQIHKSPTKNLFKNKVFLMPTLIGKIKLVVLVKYEFE